MRRFLITSPSFTGEAEIVFDDNGRLIRFDVGKTNMPVSLVRGFKERIPAFINELEMAFKGLRVTIVEVDFEINFDMWWEKYDKKINRKRCVPIWNKLNKSKQIKAYFGIEAYEKFLARINWRSKADPETYLRSEMFENEWR